MTETPGRLASRTILVVDDQPEVRELLRSTLVEAGAAVFTAGSGEEALKVAGVETLDVILLDLYMPGMDGWQFLEQLGGGRGGRPAPPIVLQTSADDYGSVQRARRLGVAAYVSKPFRLNEVVETCARVAAGARPLLGRASVPERAPRVFVAAEDGGAVARGSLIELGADGAQVDLDVPLTLGRRFRFVLEQEGHREIEAEVRWVRSTSGRWVHGLLIRRG